MLLGKEKNMLTDKYDVVEEVLRNRLEELKEHRMKAMKRLETAPAGKVRISCRENSIQYYQRKDPKDTRGKYLRKSEKELARRLAQKDYDQKIVKELNEDIDKSEEFLAYVSKYNLSAIFDQLHPLRQQLIDPIIIPTEEYASKWRKIEYQRMDFKEDAAEFYTDAGERVRSKSEIIIANKLFSVGIPYRYEYPIWFASGRTVHTDFYCLNIRTRQEFVWEHFGMMDNAEYVNAAVRKIAEYQQNGYLPGKNMIATFETSEVPINVRNIETMISEYLQ